MPQRIDDIVIYIEGLFPRRIPYIESKPTIFEVDDHLRQANENDYEPKKVSIGPIHHGKDGVESMEQHKVRFLLELLFERDDLSVEMLVEQVRRTEFYARECYSKSLNPDKDDKFLAILLLDGCFIIQLVRRYAYGKSRDPIFKSEMVIQISRDLLLFENQLPFFVLTALFDKIKTSDADDNLYLLIMFFVRETVPWLDHEKALSPPHRQPDHLLGLVYSYMSTKIPLKHHWYSSEELKNPPVIHKNSASELMDFGGIVLKMSKDNNLTFSGKVLSVPPLHVYRETESLLWNLMAYEQLQLGEEYPRHVTDYMFFLHCLARSIKDVEILRRSWIIRNYLVGDEKIIQMFDRLGTNSMISTKYTYSNIFESLKKRCSHQRYEWMSTLQRTYFNGPWSVIKLLVATFLLLFTATQVLVAVLSFTKQKCN